jgi:hypothetical protein
MVTHFVQTNCRVSWRAALYVLETLYDKGQANEKQIEALLAFALRIVNAQNKPIIRTERSDGHEIH